VAEEHGSRELVVFVVVMVGGVMYWIDVSVRGADAGVKLM
jgi:hypothetical protein